MAQITIIGGGLAGLVASIAAAETGTTVELLEAHGQLGGRARTTAAPFRANLGPHVVYDDGPFWAWLAERGLVGDEARAPLKGLRFRQHGELRRTPPMTLFRLLGSVRTQAPVDVDFRTWMTQRHGASVAQLASMAAGVFSFDADPGRLSAAFVWERLVRVFTAVPPSARYLPGGWGTLVDRLAAAARARGVVIRTGTPVDALPASPVIVATELGAARRLLDDDTLQWEGARTVLLDVGIEARRGDPFIVSDLDEAGWVERFSAPDPSLAPEGHSLLQAQLGLRDGETLGEGVHRVERLLDAGYPDWRDREVWRRRSVIDGRSGALDLPGTTWRDRPAIDRGDGVFLAGDMVAAPGLLGEVSFTSALEASRLAVAYAAKRASTTSIAPGSQQWRRANASASKESQKVSASSGLGDQSSPKAR